MFDVPQVIGQGSYGYIHYPPLLTTEEDEDNREKVQNGLLCPQVSKILEKEDAKVEMDKYALFHAMDPTCEFHLGEMTLARPSAKNNTVLATLEHGEHIVQHLSDYRLILMNYGGTSVRDYTNHVRSELLRFPNTHYHTESVVTFWKQTVRLVEGIERMIHHCMVHHDVKPSNVVYWYDVKHIQNRLNYIDFGLVNHMEDIYQSCIKNDYDFTIFFYNMPPELFFYNQPQFDAWRKLSQEDRKTQLAYFCSSWIQDETDEKYEKEEDMTTRHKYSFADSLYMSERELKYMNDFEKEITGSVDEPSSSKKTAENCFNYCTTHDAIPDTIFKKCTTTTTTTNSNVHVRPLHEFMMEGFADFMMHDIDLYVDFREFVYASMHTMDIYGLGHTLLYALIRTHTRLPRPFVRDMYSLLREMLDNNLTRRINIQSLIEQFSSIIYSLPTNT
jgi:hypothetical protein